jgi:hypothetical protein
MGESHTPPAKKQSFLWAEMMTLQRKAYNIVRTIKTGWSEWSWLFYIGSIGALLGSYFKVVGIASIALAGAFFYGMGKLHEHAEKRMKP